MSEPHKLKQGIDAHVFTAEERSRGGLMRAAKIRAAKLEAMAEGRPYKPARRRRRRRSHWAGDSRARDPDYVPIALRPPAKPQPVTCHYATCPRGLHGVPCQCPICQSVPGKDALPPHSCRCGHSSLPRREPRGPADFYDWNP